MKEHIIKKTNPDGKIAITLFADPEVANEIVKLAKQSSIEVLDAGSELNISEPTTVKKSLAEIYQAINVLGETAQIKLDKAAKEESDLNTDPIVKSLVDKFKGTK